MNLQCIYCGNTATHRVRTKTSSFYTCTACANESALTQGYILITRISPCSGRYINKDDKCSWLLKGICLHPKYAGKGCIL